MKSKILKIVMAVLAVALLAGCYPNREIALLQDRKDLPQYDKVDYEPYRIHINDEIIFRLITMDETLSKAIRSAQGSGGELNNTNTYRVYNDGTIDLPFVDTVHVHGLTLAQAEEMVRSRFRELIPDAEIKLSMYNKTFTVIGDIGTGNFPIYKEKLTIYQAIAMSGDLTNSGNRKHVRIIRPHDNDKPEVLEFDIRPNSVIESKYYYIYPNDVIYIERDKGSFYKTPSYSGFLGLITSSVALLVTVLTNVQTLLY